MMNYLQRLWLPLVIASIVLCTAGLLTGMWTGFFFLPFVLVFPAFSGRGHGSE